MGLLLRCCPVVLGFLSLLLHKINKMIEFLKSIGFAVSGVGIRAIGE